MKNQEVGDNMTESEIKDAAQKKFEIYKKSPIIVSGEIKYRNVCLPFYSEGNNINKEVLKLYNKLVEEFAKKEYELGNYVMCKIEDSVVYTKEFLEFAKSRYIRMDSSKKWKQANKERDTSKYLEFYTTEDIYEEYLEFKKEKVSE